jgi:hypothetical protein
MGRLWIQAAANGKVRVLFGPAAARERRRLGREIDRTIDRALRGDLADSEVGYVGRLATLADRLARGGAR